MDETDEKEELDKKIKKLVCFLNTLPTVKTIGSCQGHDNGGKTGNFDHPYITFVCADKRILGLLTSLDFAYEDLSEILPEFWKRQPHLKAYWEVLVVRANDSECTPEELKTENQEEDYVNYELEPYRFSYDKPSDIYGDFKEILKYYKWKWKRVKRVW